MERAEILYDAFKETFIQTRKLYLINTLLGVFALLIILLVFRDTMRIQNFQPQMNQIETQIQSLSTQIEQLSTSKYETPTKYRRAKLALDTAKLELDTWPNELPGRKKMKQKYESYLTEYSGSHEKVIGRLKIDGEPGMELFVDLQKTIERYETAKAQFNQKNSNRNRGKRQHESNVKKKIEALTVQRNQLSHTREKLQQESSQIKKDKTRLPWLGLRINPRDILPFIPFLLLLTFHALFDRLDEIFSIIKKPELAEFREELHQYPLSIFLGRYNWYSMSVRAITYLTIPSLQIMATVLIYHQHSPEAMASIPWHVNFSVAVLACIASFLYPIFVLGRHKDQVFCKSSDVRTK